MSDDNDEMFPDRPPIHYLRGEVDKLAYGMQRCSQEIATLQALAEYLRASATRLCGAGGIPETEIPVAEVTAAIADVALRLARVNAMVRALPERLSSPVG